MPTSAQHKVLGKIPSIIYALSDPFTGEIRYVGKTTDSIQSRWSSHVRHSAKGGTYKNHWIQECVSKGQPPHIEQLDAGVWDLETINSREIYWIATLGKTCNLTNSNTGGDGNQVLSVSTSTREALSALSKRNWASPDYQEKMSEKRKDYWEDNDRAKAAVSRQSKERWSDPEYKARKTFTSPEYKAKRAEIVKNTSMKNRRKCAECGYISAPLHVGRHQKGTGHYGYIDLEKAE